MRKISDWRRSSLSNPPIRCLFAVTSIALGVTLVALLVADETKRHTDRADWGGDHVGQSFPEFMTGDECLFCHRAIGATWGDNRHQLTIRPAVADGRAMKLLSELTNSEAASQTEFLLGSRHVTRFLRRSTEYGKFDMLSTSFESVPKASISDTNSGPGVPHGRLHKEALPKWESDTFGDRCAGCHCTAVDAKTRAFSATSLDCFTCHGNVDLAHTSDTSRVLLSRTNRDERQVVSICGQCHLRGGPSKSSGLPYPNTFVAGDNLLRDFQVDLSASAIQSLPIFEQHIFQNVREITHSPETGQSNVTCLSCHDVHRGTSAKHQALPKGTICWSCHESKGSEYTLRHELLPSNRQRRQHPICAF